MKKILQRKKSKIHRFGIFTLEDIKKGKEFYKIPTNKILDYNHPKAVKVGPKKYIWDERVLNYVNHSCKPNSKVDIKKLVLIAIKDIKTGEEITCDYEKTDPNGFKFICNCKNEECRKIIGKINNIKIYKMAEKLINKMNI
ncbi:unnamed protein product [marine sediment metagenome]|uniref:SET domain-containing protein n=1 Tax=marine sediment metagenome TaxID=412755 RepID=X1RNP0_9ZZZZ